MNTRFWLVYARISIQTLDSLQCPMTQNHEPKRSYMSTAERNGTALERSHRQSDMVFLLRLEHMKFHEIADEGLPFETARQDVLQITKELVSPMLFLAYQHICLNHGLSILTRLAFSSNRFHNFLYSGTTWTWCISFLGLRLVRLVKHTMSMPLPFCPSRKSSISKWFWLIIWYIHLKLGPIYDKFFLLLIHCIFQMCKFLLKFAIYMKSPSGITPRCVSPACDFAGYAKA